MKTSTNSQLLVVICSIVLWMTSSTVFANPLPGDSLTKESIKKEMKLVADWQIAHKFKYPEYDWTAGALYAGMAQWAKIAGDESYWDYLKGVGGRLNWGDGPRLYHADDQCIGQMYVELYRKYGKMYMIQPTLNTLTYISEYPSKNDLDFTKKGASDRWAWCDALFMAPTVWAKMYNVTKDKRYSKFLDHEYKATTDYLYDKSEHLYYRDSRYFTKTEKNGKKVFWGRGNGWVYAGLSTILTELPKDYKNRKMYEKIYLEMSEKLASLQGPDGYWHASLLDPDSYPTPETSASGFNCYGLAWGINNGYLSKEKYLPVVLKAWIALMCSVDPDGKLCWVQPIGGDPQKVTREMTEIYGVGAFLLAGSEMVKLTEK
ncbi:MAG: glycoside hydrolase family 88 protein [Bacteroidota bacterium]|nr:glycoside hydrolase family 88 protein [Bacteroidota bacterium]